MGFSIEDAGTNRNLVVAYLSKDVGNVLSQIRLENETFQIFDELSL